MAELILLFLAFAAAVMAGILSERILRERRDILKRLDNIEDELKHKRHTYPTANGLEDATAIAIELILRQAAEDAYRNARIEQLRTILGEVREGPHAYKDKPNDKPKPPDRE